jgi:Putative Zn-dependent protease, contains TPR repeats
MAGEEHVKQAYASILSGDYERAIRSFELAIAAEPDNPAYHHKCSITCMRSALWPKALRHAEEAVRLAPDQTDYRYHLASVQARIATEEAKSELASADPDYPSAIERLKLALELDPLLDEACLLLAAAYGALGRYHEAAQAAREALRLNPAHGEAKRLFADYRRRHRRKQRRTLH